eukprot:3854310-Pleurochrysis_carterae.AAC.3
MPHVISTNNIQAKQAGNIAALAPFPPLNLLLAVDAPSLLQPSSNFWELVSSAHRDIISVAAWQGSAACCC